MEKQGTETWGTRLCFSLRFFLHMQDEVAASLFLREPLARIIRILHIFF
jgi:hypothetical protein